MFTHRRIQEHIHKQLVETTKGRTLDSLGRLAKRLYPALVAVGFAMLCDHQLAVDAAQEKFAGALVNLRNLKNLKRRKLERGLLARASESKSTFKRFRVEKLFL